MIETARLASVFVEVADTLVDEFDVIDFLHLVTDRAGELVGSSAAGLLLADQSGTLQFMAASTEQAKHIELFQLQNHEGPCLDCFQTGRPVINADLETAGSKWPRLAPRAVAEGFRSVHAFPLRLRDQVIGALNLFGSEPKQLAHDEAQILQALTDIATIGLLQERAVRRAEVLAEQLQAALNSRVIIEQAKGAIAQTLGIGVDEAFEVLRVYARRHQRRLIEVAQAAVANPATIRELTV
jgi:GAF domain-containing protein